MKKNLKNITIFIFLLLITSCGYSPLLNTEKTYFYINDLKFSGDRQVNNYIVKELSKYQKFRENIKSYDINIISNYEKSVVNKDRSGNPKNYNIKVKTSVNIDSNKGDKINKIFERSTSLSAQSKKITEEELEKRYKKELSNVISRDIIFFLINQ